MKRAKDREQALEAQLESANARMEEMAEREGAGAAELEDDLRQLRQEADELRAAVEVGGWAENGYTREAADGAH